MKHRKLIIFILILIAAPSITFSSEEVHEHQHEQHDKEHKENDNQGHEDEGEESEFEMKNAAISTFNIKSVEIKHSKGKIFKIPKSALLVFGDKKGVFTRTGNVFKMVELSIYRKNKKDSIEVKSSELKVGDHIVISGVALLRVAFLQSTGQGGQGHAH